MITFTSTLLLTLATLWAFYLLYVLMMGAYRAFLRRRLQGLNLLLLSPPLLVAFALDVLLQFTLAWLVFWDRPAAGDWFVTHRLRRYIAAGPALGWRWRVADVLCRRLLDPFDPTGAHCDNEKPTLAEAHK